MTLSSFGLIGFQFYWVSNALRISEERFEQNIYQSLNSTISYLEKGETSDIYLSYLAKDTLMQQTLFEKIDPIEIQVVQRPISRRRPSLADSVMQQPIPQFSQQFKRIIESTGFSIEILSDLDNFLNALTPETAASILTPDEMQVLLQERQRQYAYLNQAEITYKGLRSSRIEIAIERDYDIPKDLFEKIRKINERIEATNRAMEELLQGQKDVMSRIDTSKVAIYISNLLKERGINQSFDLAIKDDKGTIIPVTPINDVFKLVRDGQQALLFPSDIIGRENYLIINFPTKKLYVLQQIWLPVLSSLVFIGIIIFCFVYAIRVIIRQKNLSEIKNDFINNMTHEFKTPIATVSLAVEALQDPDLANQDAFRNRYLSIIKEENKRLGTQVEKVLQSATLDKKDFKLKIEKIKLSDMLHAAVRQFELQIENKSGEIKFENNLKNDMIEGDPFHLSHMVNNLLDNANKYAKENPIIKIKAWDTKEDAFIAIEDNGIGMSKDALKKIFDKFYRVPMGNLHDVKGFGLGLSYVKTMLEAHHGEIQVSSEPGKGSIFTLKLPRKQ
ncbi:HAMP domain-containing sensor histidine kinase [Belliella aquatica]|uniref:histidine kinase n=2 Tax=Belliella aquatica TaxID=1323734 RepID=A0ABQ1N7H5_9BACT|nr:two-component sensor histidine kinase [Belliella aquatica]